MRQAATTTTEKKSTRKTLNNWNKMSRNVYRMYQAISPKCADIRMNETESIHIRHRSEQDREEKRYRAHCQLRNTVKHAHTHSKVQSNTQWLKPQRRHFIENTHFSAFVCDSSALFWFLVAVAVVFCLNWIDAACSVFLTRIISGCCKNRLNLLQISLCSSWFFFCCRRRRRLLLHFVIIIIVYLLFWAGPIRFNLLLNVDSRSCARNRISIARSKANHTLFTVLLGFKHVFGLSIVIWDVSELFIDNEYA